jgi:tripartite-type tricarboxylate transporter receptor subunit TctC
MASAGIGSAQHVWGEQFKMMAGVNMQHVPYRGGALAHTDLLGGQVQVMFDTMPASIEHIKAGRLRPLAVTTVTRLQVLPDIPTVGEFVPGYEASGWQGIGAPRNTPADIVDRLNREVNAGLRRSEDEIAACCPRRNGACGLARSVRKFIADETESGPR